MVETLEKGNSCTQQTLEDAFRNLLGFPYARLQCFHPLLHVIHLSIAAYGNEEIDSPHHCMDDFTFKMQSRKSLISRMTDPYASTSFRTLWAWMLLTLLDLRTSNLVSKSFCFMCIRYIFNWYSTVDNLLEVKTGSQGGIENWDVDLFYSSVYAFRLPSSPRRITQLLNAHPFIRQYSSWVLQKSNVPKEPSNEASACFLWFWLERTCCVWDNWTHSRMLWHTDGAEDEVDAASED